ncbi:MAG: hypothetical protein KGL39_56585 [Patescibacteria group bacterium]|nr:hypothetical protein [Patescibacteria group bacterium]
MTLEAALAENTAAVKELTALLKAQAGEAPAKRGRKSTASETSAGTASSGTEAQAPAQQPASTPTAPTTPPAQAPAAPTAPAVTLKDWTDVFVRVGEKYREPTVAILTKFNVARASLLPQQHWAEAIEIAKKIEADGDAAKAATPAPATSLV